MCDGTPSALATARARNVLPAPRSPARSTRSPGRSRSAMRTPSRVVARRFSRRRSTVAPSTSEPEERARRAAAENEATRPAERRCEIGRKLELHLLTEPEREERRAVRQEPPCLLGAEQTGRFLS